MQKHCITLRPLYKCVRAELMEMGMPPIYWHVGHPYNAMLRTTRYLEVRA